MEPFDKDKNQLWLDMDGVLANFDRHAETILGIPPQEYEILHGTPKFWTDLMSGDPNFFYNIPEMEDMWELFNSVKHLSPRILTGTPKTNEEEVSFQKRRWVLKTFSKEIKVPSVITTFARLKWAYCQPGDILVDDRTTHIKKWEKAGGTYIIHRSAKKSIDKLKDLGVI